MLPGASRSRCRIEDDVGEATALEVVRRRQAGLARADHHRVKDLHVVETLRLPGKVRAEAPDVSSRDEVEAALPVLCTPRDVSLHLHPLMKPPRPRPALNHRHRDQP